MPLLNTPRLRLLPLSREMVEHRLERAEFTLDDQGPGGERTLHFGPEWPGDALAMFPALLRELTTSGRAEASLTFVAVRRGDGEVIGQLGAKGGSDAAGDLEIGYGFTLASWGQGYAAEAVGALCDFLLAIGGVHRLTAQTATGNVASGRVLEKTGFVRVGTGWTADDGDLFLWTRGAG
jgi:RimJ/RimL family protein N-acetyltransferase